jgi:hypothetical protein
VTGWRSSDVERRNRITRLASDPQLEARRLILRHLKHTEQWESSEQIAHALGLDDMTVVRALIGPTGAGEIEMGRGEGGATVYRSQALRQEEER